MNSEPGIRSAVRRLSLARAVSFSGSTAAYVALPLVDWLGAKIVFGLAAIPCLLASPTLSHSRSEARSVDLETMGA